MRGVIEIAVTALALAVAGCCIRAVAEGAPDAGSGCVSEGGYVETGLLEPSGCRRCAPTVSGGWAPVPDGTPCVFPSEGAVCLAGSCQAGCFIDGSFFAPGSVNPAHTCQSCSIESTTQWTSRLPGSPCPGGTFCDSSGDCVPPPTCTVGSVEVPNRASNPADPSLCCNSALNPNGWSPRLVPTQRYPRPGACTATLVAGDFNGDGWLDLAQVDDTCGGNPGWKIWTLINHQGAWEFGPSSGLSQGNVWAMVAVDLDRDGFSDLVTSTSTTVSVLRSQGPGATFAYPPVDYSTGSYGYCALITGDFNGDGNPDVVCCAGRMLFFEGIGDGGLAPFAEIPGQASPTEAVAADFNGDGISDLAFVVGDPVDVGPAGVAILLGSRSSPFVDGGSYYYAPARAGDRIGWISAGDFDGDGSQDLAVQIQLSSSTPELFHLLILPGLGDGTFGAWQTLPLPGSVGGLACADLDVDGSEELLIPIDASEDGGTSGLYALDLADGASLQAVLPNTGLSQLVSGDFNHNRAPGIAAVSSDGAGTIVLAPYVNGCP